MLKKLSAWPCTELEFWPRTPGLTSNPNSYIVSNGCNSSVTSRRAGAAEGSGMSRNEFPNLAWGMQHMHPQFETIINSRLWCFTIIDPRVSCPLRTACHLRWVRASSDTVLAQTHRVGSWFFLLLFFLQNGELVTWVWASHSAFRNFDEYYFKIADTQKCTPC